MFAGDKGCWHVICGTPSDRAAGVRRLHREIDMKRHGRRTILLCGLALVLTGANAQAQAGSPVEDIRKELLQLPYYGVFDFLAFSYDKGTVTLTGYAYAPNLKKDAERAVKRAPKVDQVINKIEELPASLNDDELRWKIYYAIYRDPFLSRYAPGGGMLWGHRHPFSGPFSPMRGGPFLAFEAAGDYPIHIILKNGRVTLLGVVDNESDKTVAGMRAREVPGSFAVDNQLIVENSNPTKPTRR
jgi:BON domain